MDPTSAEFFQPAIQQQTPKGPRPHYRFYTEAVELPGKSLEAGRTIYENYDFVGITNPGSKDEFVKRCDKITDPFQKQFYDHWKATQEQPTDGTPLERVPWLNPAQIMELKAINIKSLEHLANIADTVIGRTGMLGLRDLRNKAIAYTKAATDGAIVIKMESEMADLRRKNEDLQNQITAMGAKFDAMEKPERPVLSVKKG